MKRARRVKSRKVKRCKPVVNSEQQAVLDAPIDVGVTMRADAGSGEGHITFAALSLNCEQQAFVDAPINVSLTLRAGAGSGKTQTLVERICRLLAEGATVLIFSHANKTVDEIKERLTKRGAEPSCMTMHSYCIMRMIAAKMPVPHAMDAVMEEAAVGFEESLLETFETHIIVDEANDLSSEQNRIVNSLYLRGYHVTLTGDMEQSIYGFQGSSPSYFKLFEEELPPDRRFELCVNYRSTNSRIVDVANAVAVDDIRMGVAVFMRPRPGALPGKAPLLVPYLGENELLYSTLDYVRSLHAEMCGSQHRKEETIMILAHGNDVLGKVYCHLMAHDVAAVLHCSKRSQEFRRIPMHLRRGGVVQLLTIHGAKGGEADHVLLLSGGDRGDSVEADGGDGSESRRMLYVACTRAKRTLRVYYREGGKEAHGQPCRWLSSAWEHFDVTRAKKFSSNFNSNFKAENVLTVTHLLKENGADGLHAYYRTQHLLEKRNFYSTSVVDLEDTEGAGEDIAKQAQKAYQFGLEMFMGKLFELHAETVFDGRGAIEEARKLVTRASSMCLNKDVWEYLQAPDGKAWWTRRGGVVVQHLYRALTESEAPAEYGEIYQELPSSLCSCFTHAFNYASLKYKGYEPVMAHYLKRVERENALAVSQNGYMPPSVESLFRPSHHYWDTYPGLRGTLSAAFDATVRVSQGSFESSDICLYAVLQCCWEPFLRKREMPEAWQPVLHLATCNRLVHLTIDELKLSDKAVSQIRQDAQRICQLLGQPMGLQVPNLVAFSCRADYGDAALSSSGTVHGKADVVFPGGPLEIKAIKMELRAEHSAQALWYACATSSAHAWLWDVYRRRLLAWKSPERPVEFLEACVQSYLKYNAPPDSAKKVWPQVVRVHARGHEYATH